MNWRFFSVIYRSSGQSRGLSYDLKLRSWVVIYVAVNGLCRCLTQQVGPFPCAIGNKYTAAHGVTGQSNDVGVGLDVIESEQLFGVGTRSKHRWNGLFQ